MEVVEWKISDRPVAYGEAVRAMERRVAQIRAGRAPELVWLLEHPPLYTAGTSARPEDLLDPDRFPVFPTGRGGQYTYHGPGQRVGYVMFDLKRRGGSVRAYVRDLETWLTTTLAAFNVKGERRPDRVGIWVDHGPIQGGRGLGAARSEAKIAAIGVRIRRWVTYHGVSLNVDPDLDHYRGIVPCGVSGSGVTSLIDLGILVSMAEVDAALKAAFEQVFGVGVTAAEEEDRG